MPRTALIIVLIAAAAYARNPHIDPAMVTGGCPSCHQGHGVAESPMMRGAQKEVCYSCHGSFGDLARSVAAGSVSPSARPPLVGDAFAQIYSHPISAEAASADGKVMTCTSCHSPHRSAPDVPPGRGGKRSPRSVDEAEFDLCESCHGRTAGQRSAVARQFDPNNRSFHPVEAPAAGHSDSAAGLSGQMISCTDCHGNDKPGGARGPHGSSTPALLRASYRTTPGNESPKAFELCYSCHVRQKVLAGTIHASHVTGRGAACQTCHSGHGSVSNRALIHIGEGESLQQVLPSASTGRLAYVSDAPGTGQCYLTCHGVDHAPKTYGTVKPATTIIGVPPTLSPTPSGEDLIPFTPRVDRRRIDMPSDRKDQP